jgi:hypothetical protein
MYVRQWRQANNPELKSAQGLKQQPETGQTGWQYKK